MTKNAKELEITASMSEHTMNFIEKLIALNFPPIISLVDL